MLRARDAFLVEVTCTAQGIIANRTPHGPWGVGGPCDHRCLRCAAQAWLELHSVGTVIYPRRQHRRRRWRRPTRTRTYSGGRAA